MEYSFSESSDSDDDIDKMKVSLLANSITTDSPSKGEINREGKINVTRSSSQEYDVEDIGSLSTSGLFFSPLRTPMTEKVKQKIPQESPSELSISKDKRQKQAKSKNSHGSSKKLKLSESQDGTEIAENLLNQAKSSDSSEAEDEFDNSVHDERLDEYKKFKKRISYECPLHYKRTNFMDQDLWAEDLQNSELWLIKVPSDFQLTSLNKKKLVEGTTTPIGKEQLKDVNYEWQLQTVKSTNVKASPYSVLLPSKNDREPKIVGTFSGEIHVTKNLPVNPYTMRLSDKKKHQVPEGLKMRNAPFGADGPVPKMNSNGQVCEAMRRSSEGHVGVSLRKSSESIEKPKKAKKKKKQKHNESFTKEENMSSKFPTMESSIVSDSSKPISHIDNVDNKYSKDIRNESLKDFKNKKKKHNKNKEESISETNTSVEPGNVKQEALIDSENIKEDKFIKEEHMEGISRKKKKKKNKTKDMLYESEPSISSKDLKSDCSSVKMENIIKEDLGDDEDTNRKKKKKKHKSKDKEMEESEFLNVNNAVVKHKIKDDNGNVSSSQDCFDYSPVKKLKKSKH